MPHSTTTNESDAGVTEKFPDLDADNGHHGLNGLNGRGESPHRSNGHVQGPTTSLVKEKWTPRRDSRVKWAAPAQGAPNGLGHHKQPSLTNSIRHIRTGSIGQNAQEIAGALRAPVSYKLILLCIAWYWSSAMTSTSSKSILTAFEKPATLTLVQFALVAMYCLLSSWVASMYPQLRTTIPALKYPIRPPTRDVVVTTLPLAAFQITGHLLSSTATSKMPVSLVHTIKGLAPLFTVLAYRFIYDIRYPKATYYSLVPLTAGVTLACSGNHSLKGQFLGIICALLATITFVSSNIFSKRLFNEAAIAEQLGMGAKSRKLDKLNLLCYSSGLAFLLTFPIWAWSEGIGILGDFLWDGSIDLVKSPNSFDHGRLALEYLFNGTFHFCQNMLAFILLSQVSPVTYSVASLIKRVFVITIAIIWFQSPTTRVQAAGILLTFLGLYLYDRSSEKNKADQRARTLTESRIAGDGPLLPLNTAQLRPVALSAASSTSGVPGPLPHTYTNGNAFSNGEDTKKSDDVGRGRPRETSNVPWMPPGTKQEDTWTLGDRKNSVVVP